MTTLVTTEATATSLEKTTSCTCVPGDVLQSDHHSRLTTEDIAKAVARHNREHPNKPLGRAARPQKTTPRG